MDAEEESAEPAARPSPSRRTLVLLVAPIIVLVIAANVGNALWPSLIKSHPLLLIALDPRNRWLILVAKEVDAFSFFTVGFVRRILSDPLFYALGFLYGDRAVRWVERRFAPDTGLVEWMEKRFSKLAPFLVFFFPGNLVCVLAGASKMKPLVFAIVNAAGTVTMLVLIWLFADAVERPVDAFTGFIGRNSKIFTGLTVVFTLYWLWDQRRRGKGEPTSISAVEKELEGPAGPAEP